MHGLVALVFVCSSAYSGESDMCCVFFFQAEDGIRDYKVTGVQTCALPILALLSIGLASALPAAAQYYAQTNLVSDEPGKAAHVDTHLVNAWGLVAGPTTPW